MLKYAQLNKMRTFTIISFSCSHFNISTAIKKWFKNGQRYSGMDNVATSNHQPNTYNNTVS